LSVTKILFPSDSVICLFHQHDDQESLKELDQKAPDFPQNT
jgi:hypothetical protein